MNAKAAGHRAGFPRVTGVLQRCAGAFGGHGEISVAASRARIVVRALYNLLTTMAGRPSRPAHSGLRENRFNFSQMRKIQIRGKLVS
jgi:hypothetical protein